eukprot:3231653-Pyramimonas_sp.AAC.1
MGMALVHLQQEPIKKHVAKAGGESAASQDRAVRSEQVAGRRLKTYDAWACKELARCKHKPKGHLGRDCLPHENPMGNPFVELG